MRPAWMYFLFKWPSNKNVPWDQIRQKSFSTWIEQLNIVPETKELICDSTYIDNPSDFLKSAVSSNTRCIPECFAEQYRRRSLSYTCRHLHCTWIPLVICPSTREPVKWASSASSTCVSTHTEPADQRGHDSGAADCNQLLIIQKMELVFSLLTLRLY